MIIYSTIFNELAIKDHVKSIFGKLAESNRPQSPEKRPWPDSFQAWRKWALILFFFGGKITRSYANRSSCSHNQDDLAVIAKSSVNDFFILYARLLLWQTGVGNQIKAMIRHLTSAKSTSMPNRQKSGSLFMLSEGKGKRDLRGDLMVIAYVKNQ